MQFLKWVTYLGVILGKEFNFMEPKFLFLNKNEPKTHLIYNMNEMK